MVLEEAKNGWSKAARPSLHFGKERMVQGRMCRNATRWVVLQHLIQQVDSAGIQGGHQTGQSSTCVVVDRVEIDRANNPATQQCQDNLVPVWGCQQSKDVIQLIRFRRSSYQGSTGI